MSSKRLNKRQLREQQELDELADAPVPTASSSAASKKSPFQQLDDSDVDESHGEDDEDDEPAHASNLSKKPTTTSLFAALGDGTDEQQNADDQEDSEPDHDISTQQASKSSKKKKNKRKKKAAAATATTEEVAGTNLHSEDQTTSQQPKSNAPTKKSSKKKATSSAPAANAASKDVSEMSIDEFDALLASQASLNAADTSNNTARSGSTAPSTLNRVSAFRTHLSLDPRNLDPAIELRRQFGSAAIKAYQNEADSTSGGRATSGARARAQANNPNLKVRSILSTPKDYWPPISRSFTGMSMDVLDSRSHGRICAWKHSKAYRQVQMQFLQAVRSYDPNALMALLRVYPYHIDTLLQLSEYSRHQGDLGQAADFNDRALFALERCASPYFTSCLSSTTSGPPLVNFNKIENRAFYMAIHRNIGFLGRRGTWKTALEWAKLLLGLGQDGEDHHAALLWIDFLAIKSRQHRWLLELIERLDEQRSRASASGGKVSHIDEISVPAKTIIDATDKEAAGEGAGYNGTLDWCVGLAYSRALAFRAVEKEEGDKTHTRSNSALRLAIARFPAVAPLLCNKAGVELTSKIAGHPAFQPSTRYSSSSDTLADLLTHIYVLRSESLWKEPGYGEWLRSTVMSLSDALTADFDLGESKRKTKPASASHNTRQGIYRHVLVSDVPDTTRQQLSAYLPPSITGSSEQMDAFDPVPPRTAPLSSAAGGDAEAEVDKEVETVTRYDDEYFAPIMSDLSSRSRSAGGAGAGQAGGGGMMQAFRRALQGLGGVQGWDAAMEAMDDETRENVMAQVMQMAQAAHGDGAMPGGFGEENEGEGEEMDAARPGAFAAIRAAMDAIWGGGGGGAEAGQGEHQGEEHDGEAHHQEEE
ncbi:Ribosome quality control complex subunit 1 [Pseudozyma hubeiensis]|nr:Ribosome quality control complex subunit 1 [Pseudozyma hubeiensis]